MGAIVRAVRPHVSGVLVVINGCSDDTEARALEAGAEIIYSEAGYARALAAGLRHLRGRCVVQLDADGQHPPEAIPALIGALNRADIAVGSRLCGRERSALTPARRAGIAALSGLARAVSGLQVRDVTSGFRALSPQAVAIYAEDFPDRVADANTLVRAHRAGLRVVEVPVRMAERSGGESMHAGFAGLRYFGRALVETAAEGLRRPAG